MNTKSPTLVDLCRLDNIGGDDAAGAPRVLVLLPDDGGRLIVTLHGGGNTVARTIEEDDGPTLRAAGVPDPTLSGRAFEAFHVNGIPYRFHTYWYDRERTGIPGHYVDRLDVTMGGATEGGARKSRQVAVDAMAFVEGSRPSTVDEANRREGLRRVERIDEKLADLAKDVGALLDERSTILPPVRVIFCRECSVQPANDDGDLLCDDCAAE